MKREDRLGSISRRAALAGLASSAGLALWTPLSRAAGEDEGPGNHPHGIERIEVNARPIAHFERSRPEVKRFGDLEFRGGLVLSSPSEHFGGWSGLLVEPDGSGLLAISDVGGWMSADIAYEGGKPAGLKIAKIGPLLDARGEPLKAKKQQDAESVTLLEGSLAKGMLLVGFERNHRIWRYPVVGREIGPARGDMKLPPDARRMPRNQGLEALAVLKAGPYKGAVVGFAERFTRGSGYHTGWMWTGDVPQKIQLEDIAGFDITDAAALDDGDLLVLERRFRWTEGVQMRLRRIRGAEIVPGARIKGRTLLEVDGGGFEIDNMEGIAVHRDGKGDRVLTLISDDNFNHFLQRTLLLQFTLLDPNSAARI